MNDKSHFSMMSSRNSKPVDVGNAICPPKTKFTPEEDNNLREFVSIYGENWELISKKMPGRKIRQVRDRYLNYLSPNLNQSPYTREEDELLRKKIKEIGTKWVKLTQFFNQRTEISLKNRWKVMQRKIRLGLPLYTDTNRNLPNIKEKPAEENAQVHEKIEKGEKKETTDASQIQQGLVLAFAEAIMPYLTNDAAQLNALKGIPKCDFWKEVYQHPQFIDDSYNSFGWY